jgi:hypothetical protein
MSSTFTRFSRLAVSQQRKRHDVLERLTSFGRSAF